MSQESGLKDDLAIGIGVGSQRSSGPDRWAPILLFVATALAVVVSIQPWAVGVFQDDGIYVILAKSLAGGEGFRYLNLPGTPNATHYPPVYPAFLALLWKLNPAFPDNVTLFKFANALLLGVAAALFYRLGRRRIGMSPASAAITSFVFTASTQVVLLAAMVLSEPLFLVILALTLAAAERAAKSGSVADALIVASAAVVLTMCRTIGAVVIPAVVLTLIWRRQWKSAVVVGVVASLGMIPWQLWVSANADAVPLALQGKYGSYTAWLMDGIQRGGFTFVRETVQLNATSLWTYGGEIVGLNLDVSAWLRVPATIVIASLFWLGMLQLLRRATVIALFLAAYLTVVLVWPFSPMRFLCAVWPLIGIAFALGVEALWSRRDDASVRWNAGGYKLSWLLQVALVLTLGGYGVFNYRFFAADTSRDGVQSLVSNRARPLVEWIVDNTEASDILAADDDPLIYLYSGRRTVPVGSFTPEEYLEPQSGPFTVERLQSIIDCYTPRFVLASTINGVYAARGLLLADPPRLDHIRTLRIGAVFRPVSATSEQSSVRPVSHEWSQPRHTGAPMNQHCAILAR